MLTRIPQETDLPNGMRVFCLQKDEVPVLYEQVKEYLKHGIELCQGDTVFDVGSNIGLFSLWLYQKFEHNINIFAFEPVPPIFEVLKLNAERFDPEKLKVFPYGLSWEQRCISFGYYPNATPLSTAYPDGSKAERDKFKKLVLNNLTDAPPHIRRLRWFPPFLRSLILDYELTKAFQVEEVSCELRTISEVIREQGVDEINLLKVDVEKSELDVLLGIDSQDWPKIQQVVVEVHDLDKRVDYVTALLREYGFFLITVDQEPVLKGSDIFGIFAVRTTSTPGHNLDEFV